MATRTPLVFTTADLSALAHDRYHHPCPRVQQRMGVVWLLSQGDTQARAGTLAGVSPATVERYAARYRRDGVAGLRVSHGVTPVSALEPHRDTPAVAFRDRPPHTVADAGERIVDPTGVRRKESAVRAVVKNVSA